MSGRGPLGRYREHMLRRSLALLAGAVVALSQPVALPATAATPVSHLSDANIVATLDPTGIVKLSADMDADLRGGSVTLLLPTRVAVPEDPDRWAKVDWRSLEVTERGTQLNYEATPQSDGLYVAIHSAASVGTRLTIRAEAVGAASDTRLTLPLPANRHGGVIKGQVSVKGPGPIQAVACRVETSPAHDCGKVLNQSQQVAWAEIAQDEQRPGVLTVDYAPGWLQRDSRVLVERLTLRTWLRHWGLPSALGIVAVAGGLWWASARRTRPAN